jgi:coproporphyrinogen III oxidase-like Fe-S oxidoreductase
MFKSRKIYCAVFFLYGVLIINLDYRYNLNTGRQKSISGSTLGISLNEPQFCSTLVPNIRGIYIHIPFCRRRCYYCDFPIVVVGDGPRNQQIYIQNYINLLLKEFDATKRFLSDFRFMNANNRIDSIYFGGGTPSLLDVSGKSQLNS